MNALRVGYIHSCLFFFFAIISIGIAPYIPAISTQIIGLLCLCLILIIGIPHGALDVLKAPRIRHCFNLTNNRLFFTIYPLISLIVIGLWWLAPSISLCSFLILAAYHFGKEDSLLYIPSGKRSIYSETLLFIILTGKGSLVIAAPLVFHHTQTLAIFNQLFSHIELPILICYGIFGISVMLSLCVFFFTLPITRYHKSLILDGLAIGLLNWTFSPLVAFTFYFCFLHSVRHSMGIIRLLGNDNWRKGTFLFIRHAAPLTLLTIFFYGIALITLSSSYTITQSVLNTIFIGLAALTVPHIIVEWIIERSDGLI